MQDIAFVKLQEILEQNERSIEEIDARRNELKLREINLIRRQALNDTEKKKLDNLKNMNEMAILELEKGDEGMLKLADELKSEKEGLKKKIIELEAKLYQKQVLELKVARMRGAVEVVESIHKEYAEAGMKKLESIEEKVKDKDKQLDFLDSIIQNLIIKERMTDDEVQEAREQLLIALKDVWPNICIKRMGELDEKSFMSAAKKKYGVEEALEKAVELCILWEDHIRDRSWHPYKVVMEGGSPKEVVDENDEKLKELKIELGDEAFEAVAKALNELNEHNPWGRYPVPELWIAHENRKISLKEGVAHLLKLWKVQKLKRQRT